MVRRCNSVPTYLILAQGLRMWMFWNGAGKKELEDGCLIDPDLIKIGQDVEGLILGEDKDGIELECLLTIKQTKDTLGAINVVTTDIGSKMERLDIIVDVVDMLSTSFQAAASLGTGDDMLGELSKKLDSLSNTLYFTSRPSGFSKQQFAELESMLPVNIMRVEVGLNI